MHQLFKKLYLFCVICCAVSGLAYADAKHTPLVLPTFHTMDGRADSHIELMGGQQTEVWLEGPEDAIGASKVNVVKGILQINAPESVIVHVTTPDLKKIMLGGHAHLKGEAMKDMNPLSLAVYGYGQVSLEGPLHLKEILATESSNIQVMWIHSGHLKVYASGKSHIHLSGDIDVLESKLYENANLESQYLRADHVYVRTNDTAVAKVLAIQQLTAFASNESMIQYYKKPNVLHRFSSTLGNVVMMASWE